MNNLKIYKAKATLNSGGIASVIMGPNNSADMIDFLGPIGFDAAWIECEHGPFTWGDIQNVTRAADLWGMTSIVRVNKNDTTLIGRTLDQGATGICVPHVNTKNDAEKVVKGAKFGPIGERGVYASRQSYGLDPLKYYEEVNDQIFLTVLIEEVTAVNNLKEILTVNDIDVFFVAPGDLAQTMGYVGQQNHPEVKKVIESTIYQIRESGRNAGMLGDVNTIEYLEKIGVNFIGVNWGPWLLENAKTYISKVNSLR